MKKTIWTIGHSTHRIQHFIAMLKSFEIERLADIRNYPGSKRYPHFNKEALEASLAERKIKYTHIKDLGGRRKPRPDSPNTAWRNEAFRGYADYMQTAPFIRAMEELEQAAAKERIAYMCAEAPWWRCHRALVSDYLKSRDWTVIHILGPGKSQEHPYTSPAKVINGQLRFWE